MKLAPGEKFGRYTIESTLGIGGMGQVFRALDNLLERVVALKIIRPDKTDREEATARFFREAKLAAKLTHPNTIQVYDLGQVEDVPFIAMEYLNGKPFTAYCGDATIRSDRKIRWLLDAARGLAAAHRLQMVHRDVKPGNVIVSAEDVVKVLDFGLAKRVATTPEIRKTFHTDLGFVVGTPAYMAPEQLVGEAADARSDQFSWGLTAYVLLTGRNPRGTDHLLLDPIRPLGADHGVSPAASAVFSRALDRDRDRRYPTLEALIMDLDLALTGARDIMTTGSFPARLVAPQPSHVPQPSFAPQPSLRAGAHEADTDQNAVAPFHVTTHPSTPSEERVRAGQPIVVPLLTKETRKLVQPAWASMTGPPPPLSQETGWRFDRRVEPSRLGSLYAAAFAPDGLRALAFGPRGIGVFDRGRWIDHPPTPDWFVPDDVWNAAAARDGSIFVAGKRGLVVRILPDGTMRRWPLPPFRCEIWLRGIEVTDHGWLSVVGATADGKGVIGWAASRGLVLQEVAHPLHAICTLPSNTQIACGVNGTLMSFRQDKSELRIIGDGELLAIAPLGAGAVVVGHDARALYVDESLGTSPEPTETESALSCVTTSNDGSAWAGSARGRILRRDTYGRWERVTPSWGVEPPILAIWTRDARVRAIAADGSLISGWKRAE